MAHCGWRRAKVVEFVCRELQFEQIKEEATSMQRISAALILATLISVPVGASEKSDVMAVVQQFDDAFNRGDRATLVAACADAAFILDDFAPNEWHGTGACGKWFDDYVAFGKANDMTDGHVAFHKARHLDIADDRAYAVIPTTINYSVKGQPSGQTGCLWTVALQKGSSGWRITAWSWSDGADIAKALPAK
jgi:ketosteroid isomerase-like protein